MKCLGSEVFQISEIFRFWRISIDFIGWPFPSWKPQIPNAPNLKKKKNGNTLSPLLFICLNILPQSVSFQSRWELWEQGISMLLSDTVRSLHPGALHAQIHQPWTKHTWKHLSPVLNVYLLSPVTIPSTIHSRAAISTVFTLSYCKWSKDLQQVGGMQTVQADMAPF
jgi:hypothetical protein